MTISDADRDQPNGEDVGAAFSEADAAHVFGFLRGASRAPRQPDVELAQLIATLREAPEETFRSALIFLVKDADRD